jgi:hypothetical protein
MSEDTKHNEWIYERLARLGVRPADDELDAGLVHYRAYECRARRRQRVRRAAALSTVIAALLLMVVPSSRVIARQLLDRFYMRRAEAVRTNETAIGTASVFHMEYATPRSPSRFAFDMAKAREEAGFAPRLPATLSEQLTSGLAVLKLSEPADARIRIRVDDLIAALHRRGITDVPVPRPWDGAEIGYHLGVGVVVVFLSGTLAQSLPPSIATPADFPIMDFTETALRAAGLSATDAHNARRLFVDTGGAFAIVPADAKSRFHEIALKSGPGLLFENDTDQDERQKCALCAGPHELILTWAAPDRVFQLRSQTMFVNEIVMLANAIN